MPIHVNHHSRNLIVEEYKGLLDIEEMNNIYNTVIVPKCQEIAPETLYVIHDLSEISLDFPRMMNLFANMKTRRDTGQLLPAMVQIFVGTTEWLDSIRAWMIKQYGSAPPLFQDLESAIDYVESVNNK